ncbi:MAG: YggS family pyridoxal phosphate enzyme [Deltaproteobacteria bacterium RIFCSPLOWO2_12_FULL_43_16]|nr:MAG: YggS family pyridoxal phosphate enzyme [Deltaproteobacteria bacterium GWA2_43_19]OGQ09762.1 MAG: YggS family pyridoxal phosphate enzyme [Deltaproteobacteria bacterium RIFCSPHIGHO2_02_FULL_43_33]OGQ35488.1 MAG: YggS family pyridoxal phosphate enzyme [Deltaproteobacteria bacterium RIFCSPLOWO2_01_FULL_42_9]OGQ58917.1 MAG: YggS family pyridoxal phosphate enzyme [Deltaproteobacteria bacterium RIFCSPLOWO2_12_FULL_43_16]HBR17684.1 YggS family pyridoxal phosphate-dependent enzyme [Deltaproteoba
MPSIAAKNIGIIRERIERAAKHVGREPREITLLAATKSVDVKRMQEAVKAGVTVFGENYVQEAKRKIKDLERSKKDIRWHFIGNLQKNKAKDAVLLFDMIESVDSIGLAKELNKRAKEKIDVLIQVNLAKEKTKGGVTEHEALVLAREIAKLENLSLKGLMTIPPYFENPEMSRPYFTELRRLAEKIRRENIPNVIMKDLSMGMSHDFEIAIEEGATIIRVGTAIFGERPK